MSAAFKKIILELEIAYLTALKARKYQLLPPFPLASERVMRRLFSGLIAQSIVFALTNSHYVHL
ncbi:MAG TPA: hypothetical protein VF629_19780 [Hymenobacter sp.]|jgi:hypothetical protein